MIHTIKKQLSLDRPPSSQQSKDNVHVSVVMPLHKSPAERKVDVALIQRAVARVKKYLHGKYPEEVQAPCPGSWNNCVFRLI